MPQDGRELDEVLALLERTPEVLRALLAGLPEGWLKESEGEGHWSPHGVLVHLLHGEQVNWIVRARHILAGERHPFPPFDRTALFAESEGESAEALLARFAAQRQANLAALRAMGLSGADLLRSGQHPELGEVRLGQLLATWATHDLNHLAQIVRTLAMRQGEAVGPWRRFLLILDASE